MKIGYAKLGRSWQLDADRASTVGGDIDVVRLLRYLATKYPEHEFVLVGRNTGQVPQELGYPPNITNPWTEWRKDWWMPTEPERAGEVIEQFRRISGTLHQELDGMIIWAGQHGSANSCIPMIGTDWPEKVLATPQFAFVNYCAGLLDFVSRWREVNIHDKNREEVWLVPDPRNYLKCRELRWPLRHPVLAQYNFYRNHKHERYQNFDNLPGDFGGAREKSVWVSKPKYVYAALELTALPHPDEIRVAEQPGSHPFGMIVNENRKQVRDQRLDVMKDWVIKNFGTEFPIHGKWTEESLEELKMKIEPIPHHELYETLRTYRTTFTTPASGSEWATSKAWECFASGSVCFFHPRYDGQGNILPKLGQRCDYQDAKELSAFLRVRTPAEFKQRVEMVSKDDGLWKDITSRQRAYFEHSWHRFNGGARPIEERLGLLTQGNAGADRDRPAEVPVRNDGEARDVASTG